MKRAPDVSDMIAGMVKLSACLLAIVSMDAAAQPAYMAGTNVNTSDHGSLIASNGSLHVPAADQEPSPVAFGLDESFDGVTPPLLPTHWEQAGWFTTADSPASTPNAAFTDDPNVVTDKSLFGPPFKIGSHTQLRFRHQMNLESSTVFPFAADGVVLEVKTSLASSYFDILDFGATFESGGYDHTMYLPGGNPLAGRQAWSGLVQGYQDVVVNFPPELAGCTIYLRWRMGTDSSVSGTGYWLDDIHIDTVPTRDEYIFADSFDLCPPEQ